MHEEILESNDFPPSGYVYDKEIDISIYQLEKLKSIIRVKNQRFKQWGWKEPRTCLFLDLYRELLPHSKYLVIVRDYQSVVNSLLKRDFGLVDKKYLSRNLLSRLAWKHFRRERNKLRFYNNNATYYLKIWIEYNEHILSLLKDLPEEDYIVINYTLLESCDRQVFSFLTNTWRFALKYFSFKEVYKKNLISKGINIDPLINDSALLSRAKGIGAEFKSYLSVF
jgi:hypothetical protein